MSNIKAIETRYKGYRFRSRLEARWAVFLDELAMDWEYEKEGYDINGVWYLPDFWLPSWDCWLEIKPERPTQQQYETYERLARDMNAPFLVGVGSPSGPHICSPVARFELFCGEISDSGGGYGWQDRAALLQRNGEIIIGVFPGDRTYWRPYLNDEPLWWVAPYTDGNVFGDRILRAADSARSARFEHGERHK